MLLGTLSLEIVLSIEAMNFESVLSYDTIRKKEFWIASTLLTYLDHLFYRRMWNFEFKWNSFSKDCNGTCHL